MRILKNLSFLLSISRMSSTNFIKNIKTNECKNCIHYQFHDFEAFHPSSFNKCSKFGEKNIINGKIEYEIAKDCRQNSEKCGIE